MEIKPPAATAETRPLQTIADLVAWRLDVNQRAMHLTETRARPLAEWDVEAVRCYLEGRVEEVKRVLGAKMPCDLIEDLPTTSSLLKTDCVPMRQPSSPIGATGSPGP